MEGHISILEQIISKQTNFGEFPLAVDTDLWPNFSEKGITLRLWAPLAQAIILNLYKKGTGDNLISQLHLQRKDNGVWEIKLHGNYIGYYYTFKTKYNNCVLPETPGIYAKTTGVNGDRAMIIDMEATNPHGWTDKYANKIANLEDAIIYELHIRDFTIQKDMGVNHPGKFLGLTEKGIVNKAGLKVGIDHLLELGVTHLQLMPVADFIGIDQSKADGKQYNWGYNPNNFNVPQGSFSTDPFNGEVRVKEFKELVCFLHRNGIGIILDVVYNHTGKCANSNFNLEAPGYYYLMGENCTWSDSTGCGNTIAVNREMAMKYVLESCKYWMSEYKIDGFRFDLMGVFEIGTINHISQELKKINDKVILYGEGWTAMPKAVSEKSMAIKQNAAKLKHLGVFNDDFRDAIKGNIFDREAPGFISGQEGVLNSIKFGLSGAINHPLVNQNKLLYSESSWAKYPQQSINYVSCHDNNTLYDKICLSTKNQNTKAKMKMHCLANAMVLTAQGVPFLHSGVEFMRTKFGAGNSYNLSDDINKIDWTLKTKWVKVFNYHKRLIDLRKSHPAFRICQAQEIVRNLGFMHIQEESVLAFQLTTKGTNDPWSKILIVYNAKTVKYKFKLPKGVWTIAVEALEVKTEGIRSVKETVTIAPISMSLFYQE